MKGNFNPDHISLMVFPIAMMLKETETVLAKATAFFYLRNSKMYLITNWHNVSGLNSLNGKPLSSNGGIPDMLSMPLMYQLAPIKWYEGQINLYENGKANWFVHPVFKERVDVIALEIEFENNEEGVMTTPINKADFSDYDLEIGDDVFVIGYPYNLTGGAFFPIWKRGSVATEPDVNIDGLPKILVDTASKPGMSGSPVIFRRNGIHTKSGKIDSSTTMGMIQNFVGVYSGRVVGDSDFDSQLGIVWKKNVIDEIIDGKIKDTLVF